MWGTNFAAARDRKGRTAATTYDQQLGAPAPPQQKPQHFRHHKALRATHGEQFPIESTRTPTFADLWPLPAPARCGCNPQLDQSQRKQWMLPKPISRTWGKPRAEGTGVEILGSKRSS